VEKEILYTTDEVAEILKVTPLTIRRLVGNGKLRACKVGRVLRFRLTDINTYLDNGIIEVSRSKSNAKLSKAEMFKQLAGKWAGSKDELESIKQAIKSSKSEAEF